MPSPSSNIGHFVTKRALLNPDLEAFVDVDTDRRFTFAELNDRVNRTAHVLTDAGVGRGDRVGLMMMNSVEFEESFFAVAKLGAVVVPLNWRLVPDELAFILGDAGADGRRLRRRVRRRRRRPAGPATARRPCATWIQVDGEHGRCGPSTTPRSSRRPTARRDRRRDGRRRPAVHHVHLGHDGPAQGRDALPLDGAVGHPHRRRHRRQHFGDRYLVALPLFHVGALTPAVAACYAGVTQVVMRTFDPVTAWRAHRGRAGDDRAARAGDVAVHAADPRRPPATSTLSRVRWIMSGASPVPGDADRGVGRARHRDPPGVRADRELRAGLPDQPRRGAVPGRLDGQGVLLHAGARRRLERRRRGARYARAS